MTNYPYEAKKGTCRFNPLEAIAHTSGYSWVGRDSVSALQSAIHTGPTAVAIEAD